MTIRPTQPVPELDAATLDGGRFRIAEQRPQAFTMIVFYRGLHCPICKPYLRGLDSQIEEFEGRGVEVIAVSTDTHERASRSKEEWELGRLQIGYGLEIAKARVGVCSFRTASRSRSPQHSPSQVSFSSAPTARCTPLRCRACRSPARTFQTCSQQ